MIGIYAGAALGGIGAVLSEHVGWRYGFRLFGGFGIAYSLVLLAFLRDAEAVEMQGDATAVSPPLFAAITGVFSSSAFVALFAVNVLVGVVNWAVYGWMPTFLKDRFNLSLGQAGMSATAYIQAASFIGVLAAGVIADRWSRTSSRARALTPAIGFLLAGPCLFVAGGSSLFPLTIAGLIVFGLGRGSIDANQMPLVRQILPPQLSATAYGLLNLISTTTGGVMVYVGGALRDAHIDLSRIFQFSGAALVLAGFILAAIRPRPSAHET